MTETTDPETVPSQNQMAQQRTHMAAERTFFAVLRTGLAIAGAGTVIVNVLGSNWPTWLSVVLASVFIIVGYSMMIVGLRRYRALASVLHVDSQLRAMSPRLMTVLTVVLQVTVVAVVGLYILSLTAFPWPF